jgi:biopolymer transport protein ExbB
MRRAGPRTLVCLAILAFAAASPAQESENPPAPAANEPNGAVPERATGTGIGRESLLRLVTQANPMLWPLAACSVVMFGYILERGLALRRGRVIPKEFTQRFLERLGQGKLDRERALELCKANDSPMARVFGHVVRYWGQPSAAIRPALDHDAAAELLDLKRNVRVLNGTATLAPLLGLLGTVIGMVESFDAVGSGRSGSGSKGDALAHGISLALLATALGLAIAVVSVAAYYYFLQRIDALSRELDDRARQALDLIAAEAHRPPVARGPILATDGLGHSAAIEPPAPPPRPRTLGRVDTARD